MKVTVKGFLHWRKYEWETAPTYLLLSHQSTNDPDYAYIRDYEFEVEIPDDFDPITVKIGILRAEKQRIQAEAHVKAENIEAQIQELLCIEDKSERCPECGSDDVIDGHAEPSYSHPETYYKACCSCNHQWGHQ